MAEAAAILAALAAVSVLSGRLVVGAFRLRWLDPFEPTRAAASAIVGTMSLTVFYARLSNRGGAAPRILGLLGAVLVALFIATLLQRRLHVLRPRGRPALWGGLGGALAVTGGLSLLPLILAGGYDCNNDTYTYCAFAEWLQGHGFGERVTVDPASPVTSIPAVWQGLGSPLGASYVLALAEAASGVSSLVLYPVVSAFGVALIACALWVVARWCLGVSPRLAAASVVAFALLPHPAYWAHHHGFLSQTFAEPALLLSVAVLGRGWAHRAGGFTGIVLLALVAAYLVTVYLSFAAVLAVAILVSWATAVGWRRGGRAMLPSLRRLAGLGVLFLVLAGVDVRTSFAGLLALAHATVGQVVPLRAGDWVRFSFGTAAYSGNGRLVESVSSLTAVAAVAALGLLVLGIAHSATNRRARGLLAALAVFVALGGYYALCVPDPWTGQRGHTWSVFKAVQWGYPLVFALQLGGLGRLRHLGRVPVLIVAVVVITLAPAHGPWGLQLGREMRTVVISERPYVEAPLIRKRLARLPPGKLLVLGRPASQSFWLAAHSALLAYPRPIVGDWQDSASVVENPGFGATLAEFLRRPLDGGIIPVLVGFEPFDARGLEPLGGGFFRVGDTAKPRLVQVLTPRGDPADPRTDRPVLSAGQGRTKLVFLSVRPLEVEVVVSTGGAIVVPAIRYQVVENFIGGPGFRDAIRGAPPPRTVDGPSPFRLRVPLVRGLTTVALTADVPAPLEGVGLKSTRSTEER